MQAKLKRGEAAFQTRSVGLSIAIFAGVPLIAALTLGAPDRALAACGASSHPAGIHAVGGGGGGVHVATGIAAPSGGGGGGGGSLGCAGGPAPRRCAACRPPVLAEWSKWARTLRAPRVMRGPLRRGPRTPPRKYTALGMRIVSETAEV